MEPTKKKYRWPTFSVPLGDTETSSLRRGAYEAQAHKEGITLSEWARRLMDKQSGFKAPEQAI